MSFSVPPRRTEIHPDAEPPRQARQKSQPERFTARISQDFLVAKRDNSPYSRRQALTQLIDQLAEVNRKDYEYFLVRSKILRHMFLEARNISEQASAIEHSRTGILELLDLAGRDNTDEQAVLLAADWAVDVSQRADSFAALNNLLQALNATVSALSRQIGPSGQVGANPASRATLLAKRAKSRRALASLKRRRGDKRMRAESDGLMAAALKDAERAYDISETHQTRFELALSLIATARVYDSEEAERGITLLRIAFESGPQIYAGYELTRQLRRRHRYEEAVAVFRIPAELDDDEPRFHANLQPFADSVIGLYYDENRDGVVREAQQHAVIACKWLEESISQQHHKAKDVVDYCFCKVIAGFSAEEAVEPLKWLRPDSSSTWDELVEISRRIAAGDKSAGEGLLLGFDDASVWGRIGTFYSDFLNDYPQAISFYKRASLVDAGSPVYHLNMARVAADRMNDFPSARAYLNQAKARKQNRLNWSKQNSASFKEIDALLNRNNA
ncbi:MAG: hypothetical protein EOM03_16650 [Clostridia bacterium]|nr:hypothetical protein [Clostridia bacterium]